MVKNTNNIVGIPRSKSPPLWHSSLEPPEKKLQDMRNWGCIEEDYSFCDYNKCDKLDGLVKNRRVAIVGPSGHLSGLSNGKKIDSYDIVIRVNHMPMDTDEFKSDYGVKTDILADCLNIHGWKRLEDNYESVKKLKYIIVPQAWDSPPHDIEKFQKKLDSYKIDNNRISTGYFYKICKEVGTLINTGFSLVIMMLNYDIKELYVTGMSFYNMNGRLSLVSDKAYFCENKDTSHTMLRHDLHQQQPQINYFHKIIAYHYGRRLTLDKFLLNNFSKSVEFVEKKVKKARPDEE